MCRKPEHPHANLLYKKLTHTDSCISSGRACINLVQSYADSFTTGPAVLTLCADFKSKVYFHQGMRPVETRLAAEVLKADFGILPADMRAAPASLQFAIIDKLPKTGLMHEHSSYLLLRLRDSMALDKEPITPDKLIELVCLRLDDAPPVDAFAGYDRGARECLNCGKAHSYRDCTAECPKCKLAFCPGACAARSASFRSLPRHSPTRSRTSSAASSLAVS